jgi:hypothetical protein
MCERFREFLFQCLVAFLEFGKMRFNRHVACPPSVRLQSDRIAVSV